MKGERAPAVPNPWRLAPAEIRTLESLAQLGVQKRVARELGLTVQTVKDNVRKANAKLGTENALRAVLLWDRWRRANPEPKAPA